MDILFGLVDFNKFKQSILTYKKGFKDTDANQAEKVNQELMEGKQGMEYEEFMKEFNLNLDDKANGWVRKVTQKDFTKIGYMMNMWQKKDPIKGRPDWLRFDCSMKNVSDKEGLLNVIKDPKVMLKGRDKNMIKEYTVFDDDGAGNMKIYSRMKMPLMSERDSIA